MFQATYSARTLSLHTEILTGIITGVFLFAVFV